MAKWTHFRFGAPPENGISTNFLNGAKESGVCCYRLKIDSNSANALSFILDSKLLSRPIYLLEGEEVGRGAAGEPTVQVRKARKAPNGFRIETPFGAIEQLKDSDKVGLGSLRRTASQFGVPANEIPKNCKWIEIFDAQGNQFATIYWSKSSAARVQGEGEYDFSRRGVSARTMPKRAASYKIK
jgi:hypothetical protein